MPVNKCNLIEKQLGVKLPSAYRKLLDEFPKSLRDTKLDLGWKQEPISERQLYADAKKIVKANIDQRRLPTPWFSDVVDPWPHHMLVIGDDECGNYWCLDVSAAKDRVVFYNHDTGSFEDPASLAQYVKKTLREVEEFNRRSIDRKGGRAAK